MPQPYLSIVAVSRNDDHGGDMAARMQAFLRSLYYWTRRYSWRAELLLVDWNPPADRPPLSEALPAPRPNDRLAVRYITVPPQLHQRYRLADALPLFQMTGKNVGIRRARGEFVLCTNVDVVFSQALAQWLGQRALDPQAVYRANRTDVPAELAPLEPLDFQAHAAQQWLRVLGKNRRYPYLLRPAPPWVERLPERRRQRVLDWLHARDAWRVRNRFTPLQRLAAELDTMACGDFTLMHRDAWAAIGGYLEADLYSLHIDTLGLGMAVVAGYRQEILPPQATAYHLDHANSWEGLQGVELLNFTKTRPCLNPQDVYTALAEMQEAGRVTPLNPPDWGLLDHDLPELRLNDRYTP